MAIVIIPPSGPERPMGRRPMKKLPDDMTGAQRKEFYKEYCQELLTSNPHLFNTKGSRKSVWQWLWDLFTCWDDGKLAKR